MTRSAASDASSPESTPAPASVGAAVPPGAVIYSRDAQGGPLSIVKDLIEGIKLGPVWRAFAWDEIQQRYRRSVLGLAWIAVSYLIFVGSIALFFADFAALGAKEFTSYVAIGFAAFTFLIGNVIDGCDVFRSARTWIKSTPLPYSIYIYKSIARSVFPFAIHLGVAFAVMAITGWRPAPIILMALPALALYVVNAVAVQWIFGLAAARYRDVSHLVSAITRILFFTTPILFVYGERGGLVKQIVDINPLTHFIEIFRAPVLGHPATAGSWPIALAITVGAWALALVGAGLLRRRLPFWV